MNREQRDLIRVCSIYHLDSKRLRKRIKSMLKYRFMGESYRDKYERKVFMEGMKVTIHDLRKAMYYIHDLRIEDDKKLEEYFSILSGAGILDEIIEESIDIAVSRCGSVGNKYYRPILDLKYDGGDGNLWVAIERKINLEHTQASARHQEALLLVGLAFYTELYAFYVRQLLKEEKRMEHRAMKNYKVRRAKGIRIAAKIQGKTERSRLTGAVVFDWKTGYDCGREKKTLLYRN